MEFARSCGTLVHPTSFPSDYGIGDLGPGARRFIDFLHSSTQSVWQLLPLGPTGYGDSPYASYSAFAGNHYLISPDILLDKGLVTLEEVEKGKRPQKTKAEYNEAYRFKYDLFLKAADRFYADASKSERSRFEEFVDQNSYWLDDYTIFMALLYHHDKQPWNTWEKGLATRDKEILKSYRKKLKREIDLHYWLQYEFYTQWMAIKEYANKQGICVVGDIPIFVDHNSADVWAHPEYFEVDEAGNRQLVSGVPPDYFSETGQLWGNPLYKWNSLEKDGYEWWVERFRQMFHLFDYIRVDHFRGFDAYWEVKATEETAMNGRWVKGPGPKLFDKIKEKLGDLPIIAEDLGVITESVVALRDGYNFPGMKILQFAFSDNSANSFLPHNYSTNHCIVYTGTHDNDTTIGWYKSAPEVEQHRCREYLQSSGNEINWDMIRAAMMSVAKYAIFPLQDLMNLDTEHRMNYPGTTENNWQWRYTDDMLNQIDQDRIRHLVEMTNRNPRVENEDANLTVIDAEESN